MLRIIWPTWKQLSGGVSASTRSLTAFIPSKTSSARLGGFLLLASLAASAQSTSTANVVTYHNDTARTGQNLNETLLTTSTVNPSQFGKLFSQPVSGWISAQPLYASQVAIPGQPNPHNVVYVATTNDIVYAFDADSNGGVSAAPLWQTSLLTGNLTLGHGVVGTPVIDLSTNTIYVVSSETNGTVPISRMHALDITTGQEKFGGPLQIQAAIPGTGSASVGGTLKFDATYEYQRAALLELNGVVYVPYGSVNDEGPWHGWIFSFTVNATTNTLQQVSAFCATPNGSGGGIWMGAAGLAGEVVDPVNKPFGRMFVATGNGTFSVNAPYSYSMSMLDIDLTGGKFTVEDSFTPALEKSLNSQDADLGSGGPVLLPTQTLASGKTLNPLVQIGKSGIFYILDRDNNNDGSNNASTEYSPAGLGGFNTGGDTVVQEVQTPLTAGFNWGAGVWGTEAYWNNNIYSGGTNVASTAQYTGAGNGLAAYSFVNGVLSTTATSQSAEQYYYPGPTPSISANGTTNGIVWALMNYQEVENGPAALLAYDATNLGNTLYSSNTNAARDTPGVALKYIVPTIANGKVYVGANGQVSVFGLFALANTAPTPMINPGTSTVNFPQTVTITDGLTGATINYTTDGTTPTSASPVYQNPIVVNTNETVNAIASANGYLVSSVATATYLSPNTPNTPQLSLASGTYAGTQILTISDSTPGAPIYYTIDGPPPTTSSPLYTGPLTIALSETVQATAIAPGPYAGSTVAGTYVIQPVGTINFSNGFTLADGPMTFNGSTTLDDFRLQLTDGGQNEAGSAFYAAPVNIQQFTTNFTFQLSNPSADGMTFTIQNNSPTALGGIGGSLGYGKIPNSIALKFDLFSNQGEGPDSTGLYTNGAVPTVPSINLTGTGIDLHSGDYINVAISYNGTVLTMTLTDAVTLATWSQNFTVNIPAIVGGNTAYVGFTGGTGGNSSSQKVTSWTYTPGPIAPNYATGFNGTGMTLNGGSAYAGGALRLVDGGLSEARSAFFTNPVNIQKFSSSFNFVIASPFADGFTFTIQNAGLTALGASGGGLGYNNVGKSVAIKFDLYNNKGEGSDSTGIFLNGALPTLPDVDLSSTGINLHSGDQFNAQIDYDGTTMTVVITDTVTLATVTQTYVVNIPSVVGGNTAYVGFTGGSGATSSIQNILTWVFNPVPVPTVPFFNGSTLTLNGGAALVGSGLQLTDGGNNEARSAFTSIPVNVQQFNTSFNFQLKKAYGDGITFAIQNAGPTALGSNGGGLGYNGIPTSVAIKFGLYSDKGAGPNSTGIYLNGALPAKGGTDLTSTGINLHSGDTFNAQFAYDGTTLTVVITDTVTKATATQSYLVNIPKVVGGNTAYVGFTGSTGSTTATQVILNWSFGPGVS